MSNFAQIRPVGAEMSHSDGQTDMKLTATFRNFAKAPKNGYMDGLVNVEQTKQTLHGASRGPYSSLQQTCQLFLYLTMTRRLLSFCNA